MENALPKRLCVQAGHICLIAWPLGNFLEEILLWNMSISPASSRTICEGDLKHSICYWTALMVRLAPPDIETKASFDGNGSRNAEAHA